MLLVGSGFQLEHVYDLPIDAFNLYVETAHRLDARRRLSYIADTTAAIADLFSKGSSVKEYREALEEVTQGEYDVRRKATRSD